MRICFLYLAISYSLNIVYFYLEPRNWKDLGGS